MMIDIQPVPAAAVYPLRHAILRPNQRLEDCEFPGDNDRDTVHFAAFSGDVIVGIASAYRQPSPSGDSPAAWRLRGMATAPEVRGTGIGRRLLSACVAHVESRGGTLIWCNARTPAVGFYERFGFVCVGEEFELEGIGPHFRMIRSCGPADHRTSGAKK